MFPLRARRLLDGPDLPVLRGGGCLPGLGRRTGGGDGLPPGGGVLPSGLLLGLEGELHGGLRGKGLPLGLTRAQIPELLKLAISTLDRFRRKFTVNRLMIHFVAASEDPYDTAMLYGYASAASGVVEALCGRGWDIRRRDIQVGVDFESTECRADAELTVTISLGRILVVLLAAGWGLIKIKRAAAGSAAATQSERKDNDGTDADPNGGIPAGQHV